MTIEKSSPTASYAAVGDVIDFTFVVTNTGNVTLTGIVVNDDRVDAPPVSSTTMLTPSESTTCTGSHLVTAADVEARAVVNVASAAAVPPSGPPVQSPPDSVTVPWAGVPSPVPPDAVDDYAVTPYNTPITIASLSNDYDGDSPLVPSTMRLIGSDGRPVMQLSVPGEGTYVVNPDGTVTFTPIDGFSGNTTPGTSRRRACRLRDARPIR